MRTAHTTGDAWRRAAIPAAPIIVGVSTLFVYWFGVADRYAVFLYEHLGAGPFDLVTTSRYWMAGLVAGGMVTSIYTPFRALVGAFTRAGQHQESPDPLRIWALCALPLAVTIVGVTTRVNTPTLTLGQGVGCATAALAALALALAPARWAVERPLDLVWLVGDGLGLVPVLLLLRTPELAGRGIVTRPLGIAVAGGSVLASITWLALMTLLRAWRRRPRHGAASILLAGLAINYLLLPLAHYLLATPPDYRYITTASNFFPESPLLLLATWAVATLLALLAARLPRSRP